MWPQLANMLSGWQWAILAAIPPAIVALYFLKLKRRPVAVPSTYLWRKTVEDLRVNSLWQRLRRNLLLWLQLAAVLAAIVALLRPGWRGAELADARLILLIDNSASMQATDVRPSRLEEAKRQARLWIDQMSPHAAAMIVSFADVARVEQPFTRDRAALLAKLAAIRPTARRTSLGEALRIAAGWAHSARDPASGDDQSQPGQPARLVIFSDGRFTDVTDVALGDLEPVYVPIGTTDAGNVAITAFHVERQPQQPERFQAFAQLANYSPTDATVEVELFAAERAASIAADRVTIPAGKQRGVTFDLGSLAVGSLHLRLAADDQLTLDNEAWAVVRTPRKMRVVLVTRGNPPLESALSTADARRWCTLQVVPPEFLQNGQYARQAQAGEFDLVIYDRCQPTSFPAANTLFVGTLPPGGTWKQKPTQAVPQVVSAEAGHPLMQAVEMGDVLIAEATPLIPPAGSQVLLDADVGPLLAISPREGWQDAILAFPLVIEGTTPGNTERHFGSNWHTRPSFPIFTLNLLHYLGREADREATETLHPGQPITVRTDRERTRVAIRTPDGTSVDLSPTRSGEFAFPGTETQGVYAAETDGGAALQYAVNLADRAESDLRVKAQPSVRIGYAEVAGSASWETVRREIWRPLLGVTLAMIVVEWYIYSHRISREPRRWGLRKETVRPVTPPS